MKAPRSPLAVPVILFAALILLMAAAGWRYYRQGVAHIKATAAEELGAIADLKAREILNWRRERLADADAVSANPFNAHRVVPYLDGAPEGLAAEGDIKNWLDAFSAAYGYMDALLIDAEGRVRLASGPSGLAIGAYAEGKVREVRDSGRALLSDFHSAREAGRIHLDLLTPILRTGAGSGREGSAGTLLFRINPRVFLYPLIQDWPVPSRSAETLLVRREGTDVLYLNELRHRQGTALALRFPAGRPDLPAAMAVRGVTGVAEGVDYRGVRVLSVIRPLADTPWFMVAKEDLSEIVAPVRARMAAVATVLVLLCLGVATVLLLWIKRREAHYYRKQYEIERGRLALVQHFEYLHKYANDIIFLADREHRVIEFNERARAAYGYAPEEMRALRVPDLRPPEARADFQETMREAEDRGGLVYETLHRRKDGTVFPVEVSLRILNIDGARYHQAILRDITERRKSEARIMDALREKDALLREIHHRVKNNMQVISSLLSLQAQRFREAGVRDAFRESQDRIRSMSLVHEKLYQTRDLSRIDFADYIKGLTGSLLGAYRPETGRIELKLDLDRTFLDINAAIPCGLILNELVLNALKHAFPGERRGVVAIELRETDGGTIRLTVRDDGIGLPEGIDIGKTDSLGLQIVALLAGQLDGRIDVRREGGTAFTLSFRVPRYETRI